MRGRAVAAAALVSLAGCGGETMSSMPSVPLLTAKGTSATLIAELPRGPYQPSSVAVGVERDLAQRRGEGLGFVRSPALEQFLEERRARLLRESGVTGVPGQVRILANPAFAAFSTADGNVYLSMGWLEYLENADEIAAILAHELSHVLLGHHSAELVASIQRRGQALHELALDTKAQLSRSRPTSQGGHKVLAEQKALLDVTDKLALPAWSRRQEREADLLGVDLLVLAGHAPTAMVTVLEKLQAWEKLNAPAEDNFWERTRQQAMTQPTEALKGAYGRVVEIVSASHPKTSERLDEVAAYLDRFHAEPAARQPQVAPWRQVAVRPEVAQVMRNYDLAFTARKALDRGRVQDAHAYARQAVTGRTAADAYPNWILAAAASSRGHQQEAIEALRRAIAAPEPIPQIYEEMIFAYERAGNLAVALTWADRATAVFGELPRWTPTRIRLLRKLGRTGDASALNLRCSLDTPEWRHECQKANETPAGSTQGRGGT